jgi:hypothetical protein
MMLAAMRMTTWVCRVPDPAQMPRMAKVADTTTAITALMLSTRTRRA